MLWCDGLIVERSGKKGRKRSPDDADEVSTEENAGTRK